jgi:hypothetical protein
MESGRPIGSVLLDLASHLHSGDAAREKVENAPE